MPGRQVIAVEANVVTSMNGPIDPLLMAVSYARPAAVDVDALYREHRVRLVRLATAITMDRQLAEEVVQDAFVGLQRHAGRIETPVGYLQRSVVNLAISSLRRRRVAADHVHVSLPAASTPEVDETRSAVLRLPPRQRAVVVLRFWDDMTVDAIAHTLGWPPGSVKSTLHRALKRLGEELL
ncbi:MAG: polymerase, sigma-24 subunit, subfamily [Ilumatobacteraceae bacterium]|nr:polymerase, sigma-24 subunit, subfamily [Ilumatobacteraceae bacterium]